MNHSLGRMSVSHVFDWRNQSCNTIQETIEQFLKMGNEGEQVPARWIQTAKGVMILQMIKGVAESGAIYVFDRLREQWYWLDFEAFDDQFTPKLFDRIFCEYKLFSYVEQPGLLLSQMRRTDA